MTFIFIDPARRKLRKKEKKDEKSQRILDAINDYLDEHLDEPVKWLLEFWAAQAAACTYQELLNLVTISSEADRMYSVWLQDYMILQSDKITPMLQDAMEAGAKSSVFSFTSPIPAGPSGSGSRPVIPTGSIPTPGGPAVPLTGFSTSEANVMEWIQTRGAELVTNATQDQIDAIRHIIAESTTSHMSSAETAKYIRPTIGLTERQAEANLKHYNAVKEQLRKDHPRMTEEAIEKKARASAERYAKKQLRTRAQTIAETEMAKAYNRGNHEYIRQLMQRGEIPIMREVWTTAKSGDVCSACEDLEGEEVAFDEEFSVEIGKNVKRTLSTDVPPLHPRCRCALQYVETGEWMSPGDSSDTLGVGSVENDPDTFYEQFESVNYEDAEAEIDKWGEQFRYELVENAVVVDKNGEVHHFVGDEKNVKIFGVNLAGAFITHNHPESEGIVSFGEDDFCFLRDHPGIACFKCVNPEYTYSINAVLKPMDNLVYNSLYVDAMKSIENANDPSIELQDYVMKLLSERGYINYEKIRFK